MRPLSTLLRPSADRAAIGLSLLCAVHCLLLPIAVAFSPAVAALGIDDESFHQWMIIIVLPISVFALFMGCAKHRNFSILAIGVAGLLVLGLTIVLGHEILGETGEKAMTLLGATLIAISHWRNYRACQHASGCSSPDDAEQEPRAAES
ncbi:MAG: MerC domain-containing protein [Pseudomonadota bacterium]